MADTKSQEVEPQARDRKLVMYVVVKFRDDNRTCFYNFNHYKWGECLTLYPCNIWTFHKLVGKEREFWLKDIRSKIKRNFPNKKNIEVFLIRKTRLKTNDEYPRFLFKILN